MSTTNQNGARAKILRALAEYGLMPVSELAAAACLSPSQARDNANHAVTDGLITKCRDDITNKLAYKITAAGRGYLAERCRKSEEEPERRPLDCLVRRLQVRRKDKQWLKT